MAATTSYTDVCQVIARATSSSINEIFVPACAAGDASAQFEKVKEQVNAGNIIYKAVNNSKASRDPPNDKVILKLFPFAKNQPEWVSKALYDYLNLRKTFDIIRYFNTGGELSYKDGLDNKDLAHHPSHEEKVSAHEIQDLFIQKMKDAEKDGLKG